MIIMIQCGFQYIYIYTHIYIHIFKYIYIYDVDQTLISHLRLGTVFLAPAAGPADFALRTAPAARTLERCLETATLCTEYDAIKYSNVVPHS